MDTDWQRFLLSRGARIAGAQVLDFGDAAAEIRETGSRPIVADLSHYGLLRASGEDSQSFLQGQLTQDMRQVEGDRLALAGYCTAKGRLLATFLVWRDDASSFCLELPAPLAESIRSRLSMYILRAKVRLADESDACVRLGVAGPSAQEALQEAHLPCPGEDMQLARETGITVLRLREALYQVVVPTPRAPELWDALAKRARPTGGGRWDWHLIRAGIPMVLPQTQEEFVPQMANLELVGGVSFKKGCYPGQEIVARTQYLGKLKRRMILAHVDGVETPPEPGDPLYSSDCQEQACGTVVAAQPAPAGGYDLLAVVQMASLEAGPIHLRRLDGPVLVATPLPYPLPA